VDAFHERLALVALRAGSGLGFALAGGYAVQAHGFLTRPSEDVDLFTSAERTDFRDGVNTIKSALREAGHRGTYAWTSAAIISPGCG
jgi:hypothetical protein